MQHSQPPRRTIISPASSPCYLGGATGKDGLKRTVPNRAPPRAVRFRILRYHPVYFPSLRNATTRRGRPRAGKVAQGHREGPRPPGATGTSDREHPGPPRQAPRRLGSAEPGSSGTRLWTVRGEPSPPLTGTAVDPSGSVPSATQWGRPQHLRAPLPLGCETDRGCAWLWAKRWNGGGHVSRTHRRRGHYRDPHPGDGADGSSQGGCVFT